MRITEWTAVLVAATLGTARADDVPPRWVPGEAFVPFTLQDQHDRPHEVGRKTRMVLVSYDMDGGALVREALDAAPPDAMETAHAVYVANVSRMPALVTRLFALPSMRKHPYPILLDRDGAVTATLIRAPGAAVAVRVADGTVSAIEPLGSAEAVRRALGQVGTAGAGVTAVPPVD